MIRSILLVLSMIALGFLYQFFSDEPNYMASMGYFSFLTLLMLWLNGCIKIDIKITFDKDGKSNRQS